MKKIADFVVEKKKLIVIMYVILIALSVVGVFNVNVNYDMSKYLPDNSDTKKGMSIMDDEFSESSSITVMIDDLSSERQLEIKEELSSIKNVDSVIYMQNDENYQKDNHSKYTVSINAGTYSDEAADVLKTIRKEYKNEKLNLSGPVVDSKLLVDTLIGDLPKIAIIAVIIIFTILFLFCDSWIEPFLFMGCIGVAIILNMGTNVFLPSVSFMTFAVGALLQMGLSMDYSIMLMNRYSQEKLDNPDPVVAMKRAIKNAFGAITGSSVTTIVGLLVLVFMSFKIGPDMGVVLAKGVFISLICIFTLLPALVVMSDKLIMKTHKKALNIKLTGFIKKVIKVRYIIVAIVVFMTIGAFILKGGLGITYIKMFDSEEQAAIEDVFGIENQTVILYKNDESQDSVDSYIKWLEEQEGVIAVQDYSNTLGMGYTYSQISKYLGFDESQAKLLFQMYANKDSKSEEEKMSIHDLVCFISDDIITNENFSALISPEQQEMIKNSKIQTESTSVEMTSADLSKAMNMDQSVVDGLFTLKTLLHTDVEKVTISLVDFVNFIADNVTSNQLFAQSIDENMSNQIVAGQAEMNASKEKMVGKNYNRLIITINYPGESKKTFSLIKDIRNKAKETFENKAYCVGDSSMGYEMDKGFSDELNFVTILTLVAILLVVIVTFKSIISSVMLVTIIQAAVFITTALVSIQGVTVNYIALILVQCILMGATIDYGILFLSNYIEVRKDYSKKEAVGIAMNLSIRTILTSSLILIGCCLTTGILMTQKVIAQTCTMIAYGTICSVIMVIVVLSSVAYIFDSVIVKNKEDKK